MKRLHRNDLYGWSVFDERLNIDFNSFVWVRPEGNVVIDPLPLGPHDRQHLEQLGGARYCVLTNADHVRAAAALSAAFGATMICATAERAAIPLPSVREVADGDEVVPGLRVFALAGSKTPGEIALVLEGTTLITGDLVRAHRPETLMLLRPEQGLSNRKAAVASIERLLVQRGLEVVLVGDGWPLFHGGWQALDALVGAHKVIAETDVSQRQPRIC